MPVYIQGVLMKGDSTAAIFFNIIFDELRCIELTLNNVPNELMCLQAFICIGMALPVL